MRPAVAGGMLVEQARPAGRHVVVVSRSPGAGLTAGAGLPGTATSGRRPARR